MYRKFSCFIAMMELVSSVLTQDCPIQFDGRVEADAKPADFDDKERSIFDEDNVIGQGLKFSKVLKFPSVTPSMFDTDSIPLEVTISDKSIFKTQTGFRRCELLPASNSGTDPSTIGIKTIHFSLQTDSSRTLNNSHEYQLAFLEDNKFSANQWVLKTGTIAGQKEDPNDLVLLGNTNDNKVLFTTPFTGDEFHNFALLMNFNDNEMTVFYSKGSDPLEEVVPATPNDLAGRGQYHFGVLKKPVGIGPNDDITKDGFQPSGINEGIIYGGIFQEDSKDGCMSKNP